MKLNDGKVIHKEVLLNKIGRMRNVEVITGWIYLCFSGSPGNDNQAGSGRRNRKDWSFELIIMYRIITRFGDT